MKKVESGVRKHDSGLLSNPYRVSFSSPVAFQVCFFWRCLGHISPLVVAAKTGLCPSFLPAFMNLSLPGEHNPSVSLQELGFLSRFWAHWQFGVNFPC